MTRDSELEINLVNWIQGFIKIFSGDDRERERKINKLLEKIYNTIFNRLNDGEIHLPNGFEEKFAEEFGKIVLYRMNILKLQEKTMRILDMFFTNDLYKKIKLLLVESHINKCNRNNIKYFHCNYHDVFYLEMENCVNCVEYKKGLVCPFEKLQETYTNLLYYHVRKFFNNETYNISKFAAAMDFLDKIYIKLGKVDKLVDYSKHNRISKKLYLIEPEYYTTRDFFFFKQNSIIEYEELTREFFKELGKYINIEIDIKSCIEIKKIESVSPHCSENVDIIELNNIEKTIRETYNIYFSYFHRHFHIVLDKYFHANFVDELYKLMWNSE